MHAIMYVGALMALCDYDPQVFGDWQTKLRGTAGASMGALFALFVTTWTPWQMKTYLETCDFLQMGSGGLCDQPVSGIATTGALNTGHALDGALRGAVKAAFGNENATFQDHFAATGKSVTIVATHARTGCANFWSVANRPRMQLWEALRASVSIPFVFPEFIIDGEPFIDGGVASNVPCHLFPPATTAAWFVSSTPSTSLTPASLYDHFTNAAQLAGMRAYASNWAWNAVPCVPSPSLSSAWKFSMTAEDVHALVVHGARCWAAMTLRFQCFIVVVYCCCVCRGYGIRSDMKDGTSCPKEGCCGGGLETF